VIFGASISLCVDSLGDFVYKFVIVMVIWFNMGFIKLVKVDIVFVFGVGVEGFSMISGIMVVGVVGVIG